MTKRKLRRKIARLEAQIAFLELPPEERAKVDAWETALYDEFLGSTFWKRGWMEPGPDVQLKFAKEENASPAASTSRKRASSRVTSKRQRSRERSS